MRDERKAAAEKVRLPGRAYLIKLLSRRTDSVCVIEENPWKMYHFQIHTDG